MAIKKMVHTNAPDFSVTAKQVIEVDLVTEVSEAFLDYAYLTIEDRALPDVRDGLKPVQRRVLYTMHKLGVTPDKEAVKSARVVGECMGKYHPHGDASIYDALVRLTQPFTLGAPLISPKGNFGSRPGDTAAASRYTECKLSPSAMFMLRDLKDDPVDMQVTYDETSEEPTVLPSRFPNLVVNGITGIAVGYATNMAPHNLGEVVDATKWLITHPNATLEKLMEYLPGPDFPTGSELLGADGIKEAYETGRGSVIMRASHKKESVGRGKTAIVFTDFPYGVDPESILASIKKNLNLGKLVGISDVADLSDKRNGIRFVVEVKAGVNPDAVLASLYKLTPLQTNFSWNSNALVDGFPVMLGMKQLLQEWIDFRKETVKRASKNKQDRLNARLHLVDGLLKALANIDAVIKIVRGAETAAVARDQLMAKFKLDEPQADYILSLQLRRLTKFDQIELNAERDTIIAEVAALETLITDDTTLGKHIIKELDEVKKESGQERRSVLLDVDLADHKKAQAEMVAATVTEIADAHCNVYVTPKGDLLRSEADYKKPFISVAGSTTRSKFIAVTNKGRGFRLDTLVLTERPQKADNVLPESLMRGEKVIIVASEALLEGNTGGIVMGTRNGQVKVATPTWPVRADVFDVISLDTDDLIIGGAWVDVPALADNDYVFITNDSSLLSFPGDKVRPQGLSGSGMAGIKLGADAKAISFSVIPAAVREQYQVVTTTGKSVKRSMYVDFPQKGRATGGVRSHKFLKGETELVLAGVVQNGELATSDGKQVPLSPIVKRDASGTALKQEELF